MKIYKNPSLLQKHCNGVIAIGNFEGTFYRYIKLTEAQSKWKTPKSEPIHKADI